MANAIFTAPAVARSGTHGSVRVEPLTRAIGALLENVSLADAARDDMLFAEIRALLLRYRVLFLHGQDITRAEHVAFARRFGQLEDHPIVGSDPDHPGLVRIYKGPDSRNEQYENAWHCDATWRECPPFGAVLRCTETPESAGDMLWANMVLAYEKLPGDIKAKIADLRARHSIEASFGAAMPIEKRLALKAQYPDAEHPVVRTHPETGEKVLFVNALHDALHQLPHAGERALRPGLRARARRTCCSYLISQAAYPRVPGALPLEAQQRRDLRQPQHPARRLEDFRPAGAQR